MLERVLRCVLGLVLLGIGLGLTVEADLGLSPWDVLHQGVSERSALSIGQASIVVSVLVLVLWIPLRERPGLGTILNAVLVGTVLDLTVWAVPDVEPLPARIALLAFGVWLWGPGSGFYIGARLGSGPRDGLMTGLGRRGLPVGRVRIGIEVAALLVGVLLGGTAGIGTVAFAFGVGPLVARWLPRLAMPLPARPADADGLAVDP